jgi:hypothetical protein
VLVAALLPGVSACQQDQPTALQLVISSDLSFPAEANRLVVSVRADGQEEFNNVYDPLPLPTGGYFPQTLDLLPGSLVNGTVEISVAAVQEPGDLSRLVVVEQKVQATFISGQIVPVDVNLSHNCIGVVCGEGGTCQNGMCVGGLVDGGPGDVPVVPDIAPRDEPIVPPDTPGDLGDGPLPGMDGDGVVGPDMPVVPPEARCPNGQPAVFYDDFTQGNRFWTFGTGTWTIDSGVMSQADNNIGDLSVAWIGDQVSDALSWGDVDITVGFNFTGLCDQTIQECTNNSGLGLIFHMTDLNNLTGYVLNLSSNNVNTDQFILSFDAYMQGTDVTDNSATCCFGSGADQPITRQVSVQVRGSNLGLGFEQPPDAPRVLQASLSQNPLPMGAVGVMTFNATVDFTFVRVCNP